MAVFSMWCAATASAAEPQPRTGNPEPGTAAQRPNIVLFLVDDMGPMDTSVPMLTDQEGNPKRHPLNDYYRTPNMERLAARGIRFSQFYAHSVCSPSRITILTGQNSARHQTTDYIHAYENNRDMDNKRFPLAVNQKVPPEWNWKGLEKKDVTLPAILKENGYRTIHIGKAHLAPDEHEGTDPRHLGFDVNIGGCAIGRPDNYYGEKGYGVGTEVAVPHLEKYHDTDTYLTEALTLEAIVELDKAIAQEKPFFLHMSHYAVHSPFNPDPRFLDNYDKGKGQVFATMIEGMDKSLGDLMDHLEAKGVAENTLILFLGDNGSDSPIGDYNAIASSAPLRGKKGTRWEGGVRVPFIAAWAKPNPDNPWQKKLPIPAGSIRQEVGNCADLFPTITALVDAPVPEDYPVDGKNLAKLLTGKPDPKHRNTFLSHYPHPRNGRGNHFFTVYRKGDWKVVHRYLDDKNPYELYDLANDPTESKNLATSQPEKLKSMAHAMIAELESMGALYPVVDGKVIKPVMP
jgi:arylsulfatase A-like enzyme